MNPFEKWKVRRQLPYKLLLQVLKIVFVTAQLILFAEMRMSHVDFMEDTTTVMRHKFLREWNDDRDALQYPPAEGRYSVYDGEGIFKHFQFIIKSYYSIQTDSFASFSYDVQHLHKKDQEHNAALNAGVVFESIPYINVCENRIANVTVNNNTYDFDIREIDECMKLNLTKKEVNEISTDDEKWETVKLAFERRGVTFKAEDALKISKVTLDFKLRTIHFSPTAGDQKPECYKIDVKITFDNSRHTGQVHVTLSTVVSYVTVCNGRVIKGVGLNLDTIVIAVIDILVLGLCILSFILCGRALIKAHLLQHKASEYFENCFKITLPLSDKLDFWNLWYVMIVINDCLIGIGTIAKISIEFRDFDSALFTLTGIFLGMGALLVYVGVLRYFGFFSQYNILILTLKKSLPNILRFMTCAIVLYMGFLIGGWVIIGPYSMKFRSLGESSEALFSLLNGDDMFATFYTINDSNTVIKVFGTVYIYIFVSLFIYVVLSLFIAIIMDAYEVVKDRYYEGLSLDRSLLRDFVQTAPIPTELGTADAREHFAPSSLLNLGREVIEELMTIYPSSESDTELLTSSTNHEMAGRDSRSVRALNFIDQLRDRICRLRHGTRFEAFSNPLNDQMSDSSSSSNSRSNSVRFSQGVVLEPTQNHRNNNEIL
ncbi:hypothetical protein WR25_24918 [Diploscapter pachys]|uniref:Uncharacterized protein n=1 Tax=Diploscapter pachys TaxID=2018661 RepID=A0A2A2LC83_9BILA|nr:hypothetical protein WR25_24918 [Diploscapter pachys]